MAFTQDLACWSYSDPYFKLTFKNHRVHKYSSVRGVMTNTPHVLKQLLEMGIPQGSEARQTERLFQLLKKQFQEDDVINDKVGSWDLDHDTKRVAVFWDDGSVEEHDLSFFEIIENYKMLEALGEKALTFDEADGDVATELETLIKVRVMSKTQAEFRDECEQVYLGVDDGDESYISEDDGVVDA